MTNLDLSDHDTLRAWLKPFSKRKRALLMCRANLRVFAHVGLYPGADPEEVILPCFRALMTSAALARGIEDRSAKKLRNIGWAAECAIDAQAHQTPADYPPESAGYAVSAVNTSRSVAAYAISTAADSAEEAARGTGGRAAYAALLADGALPETSTRWGPVWAKGQCPKELKACRKAFVQVLKDDSNWDFWRIWYGQMRKGTFEEWETLRQITLIQNKVWTRGLSAVAGAIAEIERDRDTRKVRA